MRIINRISLFVKICDEVSLIPSSQLKQLMGLSRWKYAEFLLSVGEYYYRLKELNTE